MQGSELKLRVEDFAFRVSVLGPQGVSVSSPPFPDDAVLSGLGFAGWCLGLCLQGSVGVTP